MALLSAIASVSIVGIGLSLVMSLLSLLLGEQGYSARAIGLNPAAAGLATLVGAPLAPLLARRFGLTPVLFFSLFLGALCLAAFAVTRSYWAWLVLRAIFGGALTMQFVLSEYWINVLAPPERRGFIMGLYATSLALGFVTGPAILSGVGTEGTLPFLIPIGLFLLASLPILLGARAAPEIETASESGVVSFLLRAPVASFAGLLHGMIEMAAFGLLPLFALQANLGPAMGARLAGFFALGNVLFQIPLGLASDRFERRQLLLIISLLGLGGALLLPLVGPTHQNLFCGLLVIWGGVAGSLYPIGLAYLGAQYKGAELASANAAFVMLYSLGMLAGPPLMGYGMDLLMPNGFFLTIGALFTLYLGFIAWCLVRGHD
ncbi:major facilitator superfamily MFS_1 [Beijerinckia indica subsp. indica ATCC 9039]|uniref:Major facilitator superfamily MFS_1 n=2 Tax=Beijerinckia TaxID=532 RepID=B2IBG1_BEII9|nr:major facilitator superfamily MFS_1 [Beijerinckia indica subsp. indica ATCC 9039]